MYMSLFLDPPREIFYYLLLCNKVITPSEPFSDNSICLLYHRASGIVYYDKSGVSNHYGGNIVLPIIQVVREINTGNKPWGIHRINR